MGWGFEVTLFGGVLLAASLGAGACSSETTELGPTTSSGASSSSGGTAGTGGATGGQGGLGGAQGGSGGQAASTDFQQPGPYAVTSADGQQAMAGCGLSNQMSYTLYTPTGVEQAPLVVLGHGFQRNRAKMAQMSERMASHGVRVAALDYCHLSALDTDHQQNAADQVALGHALANGTGVLHAGYSAGGLAAVLAASTDADAIGLLGLDAVDSAGLGANAAPSVQAPAFGIEGEPGSCNQNNNDGTHLVLLVPGGSAVRAIGAQHCDFEDPTDVLCTSLCGQGSASERPLIRALATAFVAWRTGADPSGEDWVLPAGGRYQLLVGSGAIEGL